MTQLVIVHYRNVLQNSCPKVILAPLHRQQSSDRHETCVDHPLLDLLDCGDFNWFDLCVIDGWPHWIPFSLRLGARGGSAMWRGRRFSGTQVVQAIESEGTHLLDVGNNDLISRHLLMVSNLITSLQWAADWNIWHILRDGEAGGAQNTATARYLSAVETAWGQCSILQRLEVVSGIKSVVTQWSEWIYIYFMNHNNRDQKNWSELNDCGDR